MLRFGKKSRSRLSAPVPGLPDVLPYIPPPTPSGSLPAVHIPASKPLTHLPREVLPLPGCLHGSAQVSPLRDAPDSQGCLPSSSFVLFLAPSVQIRLTYLSSRSWLFSCTIRRVPRAEWPCLACSLLGDRPVQCRPALSGAAHLCCCGCLRSPNHLSPPLEFGLYLPHPLSRASPLSVLWDPILSWVPSTFPSHFVCLLPGESLVLPESTAFPSALSRAVQTPRLLVPPAA